jgi:hypothetical protein
MSSYTELEILSPLAGDKKATGQVKYLSLSPFLLVYFCPPIVCIDGHRLNFFCQITALISKDI